MAHIGIVDHDKPTSVCCQIRMKMTHAKPNANRLHCSTTVTVADPFLDGCRDSAGREFCAAALSKPLHPHNRARRFRPHIGPTPDKLMALSIYCQIDTATVPFFRLLSRHSSAATSGVRSVIKKIRMTCPTVTTATSPW